MGAKGICRAARVGNCKGGRAGGVGAAGNHMERDEKYRGGNKEIDHAKTAENEYLVDRRDEGTLTERVQKRIEEGHVARTKKGKPKKIRDDAVPMVEFFIGLSPDSGLGADQTRAYLHAGFNFVAERWGRENIVSAVIHNDEKTPHLSIALVPIVDGKLSAKALLNPSGDDNKGYRKDYGSSALSYARDLQQLQDDFYVEVSGRFGLERGERADLSKPYEQRKADGEIKRHKSPEQLKAETLKEVGEIERERDRLMRFDIDSRLEVEKLDQKKQRLLEKERGIIEKGKKIMFGEAAAFVHNHAEDVGRLSELTRGIKAIRDDRDKNYTPNHGIDNRAYKKAQEIAARQVAAADERVKQEQAKAAQQVAAAQDQMMAAIRDREFSEKLAKEEEEKRKKAEEMAELKIGAAEMAAKSMMEAADEKQEKAEEQLNRMIEHYEHEEGKGAWAGFAQRQNERMELSYKMPGMW